MTVVNALHVLLKMWMFRITSSISHKPNSYQIGFASLFCFVPSISCLRSYGFMLIAVGSTSQLDSFDFPSLSQSPQCGGIKICPLYVLLASQSDQSVLFASNKMQCQFPRSLSLMVISQIIRSCNMFVFFLCCSCLIYLFQSIVKVSYIKDMVLACCSFKDKYFIFKVLFSLS